VKPADIKPLVWADGEVRLCDGEPVVPLSVALDAIEAAIESKITMEGLDDWQSRVIELREMCK